MSKQRIWEYKKIIRKWENPISMIRHYESLKELDNYELNYIVIAGIINREKINMDIIKEMNCKNSKKILSCILKDYEKINAAIEEKKKYYNTLSYYEGLYSLVLRSCAFYGIDSFEDLSVDMILRKDIEIILSKAITPIYRLLDLRYISGYSNQPAKEILLSRKEHKHNELSEEILNIIAEYRKVIELKKGNITVKTNIARIINFLEWIISRRENNDFTSLIEITNDDWKEYIVYIGNNNEITQKTKSGKLLAVVQFFEWIKFSHDDLINENLLIRREHFKKLTRDCENKTSLAFSSEESAGKLINYITKEYKPIDIYEKFFIEAIIIAANTGMRRSEIAALELGRITFCEETGLYMINKDTIDKLGQINGTIWVTKQGYDAIKRVEKLRKNNDMLISRLGKKGEKEYIRLFEYRNSDILYSPKFDDFLIKINRLAGVNKSENEVAAGMHGFRHYYAMKIFKKSNYNITAVRYLLRHKSYDMSKKYLVQEQEKEIAVMREEIEKDVKYEGLAINTIVNKLCSNELSKLILSKKLDRISKDLMESIDIKAMKKLEIGYCIEPCENANKCFKCKNFLIEDSEKEKLILYAKEMFEIISYKANILDGSKVDKKIILQQDINDFMFIIRELEGLGVSKNDINTLILGGDYGE